MEFFDNEKGEQKNDDFWIRNNAVIVSMAVGFVIILYSVALFLDPRLKYLSNKKKGTTDNPDVLLIVLYFLMHFSFAMIVIGILQFVLRETVDSFSKSRKWIFGMSIKLNNVIFGNLVVLFWLFSMIYAFCCIENPTVYTPNNIRQLIDDTNSSNLMGYCYGYRRSYKISCYSTVYTFKLNLTNYSRTSFDDYDYPNNYAYRLNKVDKKDEHTDAIFESCVNAIKEGYRNNGKDLWKVYTGIYPEFNDVYYVSKYGKFKGKFSKVSRIFTFIFGIPTVFDHYIKSMEIFLINISRVISHNGISHDFDLSNFNIEASHDIDLNSIYNSFIQNY